jgi:hypothetical protein
MPWPPLVVSAKGRADFALGPPPLGTHARVLFVSYRANAETFWLLSRRGAGGTGSVRRAGELLRWRAKFVLDAALQVEQTAQAFGAMTLR